MRMTARTAWEEMLFPEDLRVERWEEQRVACLIAKKYYGKRDLGETKTDPRVIL